MELPIPLIPAALMFLPERLLPAPMRRAAPAGPMRRADPPLSLPERLVPQLVRLFPPVPDPRPVHRLPTLERRFLRALDPPAEPRLPGLPRPVPDRPVPPARRRLVLPAPQPPDPRPPVPPADWFPDLPAALVLITESIRPAGFCLRGFCFARSCPAGRIRHGGNGAFFCVCFGGFERG